MSQTISLFDELKNGGYESCLLTTFNIDFPFYEEVLLRRMRSAGVFHHLLMVDQTMCVQAMAERPPRMSGHHYSLAPMACQGAFHPKLLLLLGKHKGLLAVGSHNVTLSGFGQNLEITNVVRYNRVEPESFPIFMAAYRACLTWFEDYGQTLPREIYESLARVKQLCPWLEGDALEQPDNCRLLFRSRSNAPLWEQLQPQLPGEIKGITAGSAFFDRSLSFVRTLASLGAERFILGVQPGRVKAPPALLDLDGVVSVDSSQLLDGAAESRYIHAKFIHVESEQGQLLVSGSANLSAPAWLLNGDQGNAEAVIVRTDDQVSDDMRALGIDQLLECEPLTSLPEPPADVMSESTATSQLRVVGLDEHHEHVEVPLCASWQGVVEAAYPTTSNGRLVVPSRVVGKMLRVDCAELRPGELLWVLVDQQPVARVLVHYIQQIRQYAATGMERKIRQALGSLGTNTPDLNLLSLCMDRLTSTESITANLRTVQNNRPRPSDESEHTPETLISHFNERPVDARSGRKRLNAEGDIGLIMDFLIRSMGTQTTSAAKGLNEDGQGRNEEELIGADDEESITSPTDEEVKAEQARLCRAKLERTVNRLESFLATSAEPSRVSATLGVLILIQRLTQQDILKDSVDGELLATLFRCVCAHLLDDKDSGFNAEDDEQICNSDEWGRLLGYVTWLGFFAGAALRPRPPLSASIEQAELCYWQNACWLYLAQRLKVDSLARTEAARLVSESDSPGIRSWFDHLCNSDIDNLIQNLDGFCVAASPGGVYFGYRLVIDNGDYVRLASVEQPGKFAQFGAAFVDVIERRRISA